MLDITHLHKRYPSGGGLNGLSLSVRERETLVLLGPSGAGKSTLLRCIAGIETPASGRIRCGDEIWTEVAPREEEGRLVSWIDPERRQVGMVFQQDALWPHRTVREHLTLVVGVQVSGRIDRRARVSEWLRWSGLSDHADRLPATLSGGERRRLAIACACARRPKLLLLDEPLVGLDPAAAADLTGRIESVCRDSGCAVIWVTHTQEAALPPCERVAVCFEGKIEQEGTPGELFLSPRTVEVARLVGFRNFLRGTPLADGAMDTECGRLTVSPPTEPFLSGPIWLGLRSDQCVQDSQGSCLGRVAGIRYLSGRRCYRVVVGRATLEVEAGLDLPDGAAIRFHIHGEAVALQGSPGETV